LTSLPSIGGVVKVVIAGGHGQIALRLTRMLAERGDEVLGIIRDEGQSGDLAQVGSVPVLLDLENASTEDLVEVVAGSNAVVFAAGAGPGSGAPRKETVDYGAAVKLREASWRSGVDRYLMISAMGAANPPGGDDVFSVYLRAKARADQELMASDLKWTIARPGRLTNEPGTGRVDLGGRVVGGEIPREDVASVLVACLDDPRTVGHVFEVVGGETPIGEAIDTLVG
jgi:uncharacterized protein YbjT (DUF2867 family)